jgi:3-dehydroquinate dehydratase II
VRPPGKRPETGKGNGYEWENAVPRRLHEHSVWVESSVTCSGYMDGRSQSVLVSLHSTLQSTQHRIEKKNDMAKTVLLLNGPNLNLLGTREPEIYGSTTLKDVENAASKQADDIGLQLHTFQSNHEGALLDRIQQARGNVQFIIINPGGLTHSSVALRDSLLAVEIPFLELHVSNVHAREPWRNHSYLSDKAVGVICGLGVFGYTAALDFAARRLKAVESKP